jgi:DNA topoisomerase I, bacterial
MKNLVIVESPAKAKTIEKYLGKGFTVMSSIGHIRQIPKGKDAVDVKNDFKTKYEVDPEKKKTVADLKKAVAANDQVWLATDEDREGEAIAWHLQEVLKLPKDTKRITFHEITKNALEEAIKSPRAIDMGLVHAQQARQILDRLVGFELSPVVWQKVPGGKSAGRVQSPAVRLIVEREREIIGFDSKFSFKISALFNCKGETFKAELVKNISSEDEVNRLFDELKNAVFTITDVTKNPGTRNPSAPFTTSTLQQEANAKLGFSARTTMSSAQKLYQSGKITYMRTDSVNLSSQAIGQIASYVKSTFGEEYSKTRQFATKNSSAQEAHEAIRPTNISDESSGSDSYDTKLYKLIRNRTLASQMAAAQLEKTVVTISASTIKEVFVAKGEIVTFDGFLKVYGGLKDSNLPKVSTGDKLKEDEILARQTFAKPPARYTEGSLVKKLEELGIGRPSTYATILNTIQTRGYVKKGESEGKDHEVIEIKLANGKISRDVVSEKTGSDKGKLVPDPVGEILSDFLVDHFNQVVDYGFTAGVEKDFDKIATDKEDKVKMLHSFYVPFHRLIEGASEIDRKEVGKAKELGIDPKSQKPVLARIGRFGPMLQLGDGEGEEKPKFAPLPDGATLNTITLDEALEMFKLPRTVGKTKDGKEITSNIGRFGPYIQIEKIYVSIKPLDPFSITLDEALEKYDAKLEQEKNRNIADFGCIKVLNGPFGPYVTDGKKNARIPKDTDPKTVTESIAKELLEKAPARSSSRAKRRPAKKRRVIKRSKKA